MTIRQQLNDLFKHTISRALGEEYANVDPLIQPVNPPHPGDYQANFAMSLAKKMGRSPREIAAKIVEHFHYPDICDQVTVSGPGFINIFLSNQYLQKSLASIASDPRCGVPKIDTSSPVIIEYGSPNVAKEMHVGHLRSAFIGDAIARVLSFLGYHVIRQNHVGDWGTQFGMLIQYMLEINWDMSAKHTIADASSLYKKAKQRFDADEEFAQKAREKVVDLQGGDKETLAIWQSLVLESERHFQEVYQRLGVLLTQEDIRGESFYNPMLPKIVEELQHLKLATKSQEATVVFLEGFVDRDANPVPCIIQKSDGGYLYATTDLAAVKYRIETLGAKRIVYVVDARQALHFAMIFAIAHKTGWADASIALEHAAFGTVLGKDRKPFKTRSGESIQLVALLDEAEKRASEIVAHKPNLTTEQRNHISRVIGIGALKYADLSSDKIKDYVFDWDRMLSFEGNTAPYLLNAYVRIRAIFRKGNVDAKTLTQHVIHLTDDLERSLAIRILEFPEIVAAVSDELAPHRLCAYLYDLASTFHKFYEHCPVLTASDEVSASRLLLCDLTARTLKLGLELLGIETLEQM